MRKEIKVEVGKGKFKTLRGLERRLGKVVKKSAFFAEALARQFAPKRTRNLARHINARKVSELHWTVGTNVEYAAVQEFGSRKKDYVIRPRKALALRFKTRGRRSGGRRNRKRGRRR